MRSSTRSEASIQKAVVTYAKRHDMIAIKQSTAGRYGTSGWPDYLFITPAGLAFFIEFKREGLTLTPLQQQRMTELQGRIPAFMVDNVPLGKSIIDRFI
jgi:hypothetical protein